MMNKGQTAVFRFNVLKIVHPYYLAIGLDCFMQTMLAEYRKRTAFSFTFMIFKLLSKMQQLENS